MLLMTFLQFNVYWKFQPLTSFENIKRKQKIVSAFPIPELVSDAAVTESAIFGSTAQKF